MKNELVKTKEINYELSGEIFESIKNANRILINCHRSPDPDGVGSALALYKAISNLGKETKVVCPNNISSDLAFLPNSGKVEKVDFNSLNFDNFDLFIVLDSSNLEMVFGEKNEIDKPQIKTIVIDHHITNSKFGNLNLVDDRASSAAEVVKLLMDDWKISIDKDVAQCLLTGIIGDTGSFSFPNVTPRTLKASMELMSKGADKNEIVFNIYRSMEFNKLKFWGEIIKSMKLDNESRFVWSAIPIEIFNSFDRPQSGKETAASQFTPIIQDTDFGIVMVEEDKNVLAVSLRSRKDFDVSKIAQELGGGGHREASGAKIYDLPFDEAVEKVLQTARKFAGKK